MHWQLCLAFHKQCNVKGKIRKDNWLAGLNRSWPFYIMLYPFELYWAKKKNNLIPLSFRWAQPGWFLVLTLGKETSQEELALIFKYLPTDQPFPISSSLPSSSFLTKTEIWMVLVSKDAFPLLAFGAGSSKWLVSCTCSEWCDVCHTGSHFRLDLVRLGWVGLMLDLHSGCSAQWVRLGWTWTVCQTGSQVTTSLSTSPTSPWIRQEMRMNKLNSPEG